MERPTPDGTLEDTIYLNSGSRDLYPATNIMNSLDIVFNDLNDKLKRHENGSVPATVSRRPIQLHTFIVFPDK